MLDEIIKVELLAAEAKRRGLDKRPETQERTRQILRDELLRRTRDGMPAPADIPEAEVRAYYEKHRDQFREPERRRVAHIVVADAAKAKRVLALAAKATPAEWGRSRARALARQAAEERAESCRSSSPAISASFRRRATAAAKTRECPKPVRKAVFEIEKLGGVLAEPVADAGRFHVVRMTGRTERARSLACRSRSRDPRGDPAGTDQAVRGEARARAARALPGEDRRGRVEAGRAAGELGARCGSAAAPAAGAPVSR